MNLTNFVILFLIILMFITLMDCMDKDKEKKKSKPRKQYGQSSTQDESVVPLLGHSINEGSRGEEHYETYQPLEMQSSNLSESNPPIVNYPHETVYHSDGQPLYKVHYNPPGDVQHEIQKFKIWSREELEESNDKSGVIEESEILYVKDEEENKYRKSFVWNYFTLYNQLYYKEDGNPVIINRLAYCNYCDKEPYIIHSNTAGILKAHLNYSHSSETSIDFENLNIGRKEKNKTIQTDQGEIPDIDITLKREKTQEEINYEKTRNFISPIYDYFGIIENKANCLFNYNDYRQTCNQEIKFELNSSNLRTHLTTHHKLAYEEFKEKPSMTNNGRRINKRLFKKRLKKGKYLKNTKKHKQN